MLIFNTKQHYGIVAKILHWLIAILILLMLAVSFWMGDVPQLWKGTVYNTHKLIGLTVLVLMIIRLAWLIINPKPSPSHLIPPWQKILSHSIHGLLYIFVILMPIAGWIMSTAATKYPHLGSYQFILPGVPTSKTLAHTFAQAHEIVAWTLIALITLHIIAAFKHAIIDQDGVLQRMWFKEQSSLTIKPLATPDQIMEQ